MLKRFIAYFAGPWTFMIYSSSVLYWSDAITYFVVGALWMFLSWEDQKHLSVPSNLLYIIAAITVFLGIIGMSPSFVQIKITALLVVALLPLKFYEALKQRPTLGNADVIAIATLALHLTFDTLGIWLALAGCLGILSYLKDNKSRDRKIPFLPNLTASWLIVISGSNLL